MRLGHGVRAAALAVAGSMAIVACGSFGGPVVPADAERISMVNATTTPVEVRVNGTWIGTYPAWSEQMDLPIHGNGGPPWDIEFLAPEGRQMNVLRISGDAGDPIATVGYSSPCGEFMAWSGSRPEDAPVVAGRTVPPTPPDC